MRVTTWLLCALTAAAASTATNAQPTPLEVEMAEMLKGTLHIIPHRESADGVQTACGLEFAAAHTHPYSTPYPFMYRGPDVCVVAVAARRLLTASIRASSCSLNRSLQESSLSLSRYLS